MCGRFVGNFTSEQLASELHDAATAAGLKLHFPEPERLLANNFNTAPTQAIPVLRVDEGHLIVDGMRWGLVPVWAKEASVGSQMINARSETITEKPSFRNLVPHHRCIVPMNGFYEWDRSDPKQKIPYFVPREDGHLMLVASLWTKSPALGDMHTCALITRDSRDDLDQVHDRSPVEFTADVAMDWLLADPPPLELMWGDQPRFAPVRVSTEVNSVRNNGPQLILPVDDVAEDTAEPDQPTLF